MAQIDMRNATLRIRDGDSRTAAVNNSGVYAKDTKTMTVDGATYSKATIIGRRFTVVGDTTIQTISAGSDTVGAVTSITFAPGLGAAVADNAVISIFPNELEVNVGEGNLTFSEKVARTYTTNRGILDTVRNGNDTPMDIKFDIMWEWVTGATSDPPTIVDALKKIGNAATWITSSADACEPYAVDLQVEYVPPCGTEKTETITFEDFRYESLDYDLKAGQISCSGKCNRTDATPVRG